MSHGKKRAGAKLIFASAFKMKLRKESDMIKKNQCMKIVILSVLLVMFCPLEVYASSVEEVKALVADIPYELWPEAPEISSGSAIVVERNSGIILYEKNCTEARYPASTTKLLTALITLEETSLDDIVTFSWSSVNTIGSGASHIGMRTGDKLRVYDCLCGLLIPSANEVANALAEHISGSVEEFANLMNERGEELGLINSHFENANGLHDANHYTCAYDLYLILDACVEIPSFIEIDSKTAYVKKADDVLNHDIPMGTTHMLLKKSSEYYNANAICGKTGYTDEAGRVLATYAECNGMEVICITMEGTGQNHFVDTNKLLDYVFSNFSITQLSADSFQGADISKVTPLQVEREAFLLQESLEQGEVVLPTTVSLEDLNRNFRTDADCTKYMEYSLNGYVLGSVKMTEEAEPNPAFLQKESYTSHLVTVDGTLYVIEIGWMIAIVSILVIISLFLARVITNKKNEKKSLTKQKVAGNQNYADDKVKYSKKLKQNLKKEE